VITAAALCPAPPMLIRELNGSSPAVPELRQACLDAVAEVVATGPDRIAVVGAADQTWSWDGASSLDLGRFAPGLARAAGSAPSAGTPGLPPSLGVGAWLLGECGYRGERGLHGLAHDEPAPRCAEAGAALSASARRVGLLVMADGSARRTLKAPGYLDDRSAAFDAEVERAISEGDLGALLRVDDELARELMATGRPAWQALAGALSRLRVSSHVRYLGAPFGVAYLVASLLPSPWLTALAAG
jgi:hypothetical protein